MADVDVIVVGAGHNGLIAAAYLARAGMRVAVLERRANLGGAAGTVELWPGHRVDVGASAHVVFKQTGIAEDLGLAEHGLEYLEFDPQYVAQFPDGTAIHFWRDLDRTCESIARLSPGDAEAYRRFVHTWAPVGPFFLDLFSSPASVSGAAARVWAQLRRGGPGAVELLAGLASSPRALLDKYFRDPRLRAALAFSAAQTGVPTNTAGAGATVLWRAMGHAWGNPTPRGGSGALAEALHRKLASLGATVLPAQPARAVRVTAEGVEVDTDAGTLGARAVVMATHLTTTLDLLGDALPARTAARLRAVPLGNGCGVTLHLATGALPDYPALPDGGAAAHRAVQVFCPSPEHLDRAYEDFLAGRPAREPAVAITSPSAFDATRAPPGRHVLSLWAQWYPYALADGRRWDDIADAEAERILDAVAAYAPGLRASIRERSFGSPVVIERDLDLARANLMHLPMTPDRLLTSRPVRGYARHRLAPRVYVTGASTHPGGGVIGTSGRLAADAVLR
ncbi:MAG: dependent oxidoreductase, partial [Myxococcaceae bacterium]|nr:dependent oxidoreductase [Myxococcaceae bacterium]